MPETKPVTLVRNFVPISTAAVSVPAGTAGGGWGPRAGAPRLPAGGRPGAVRGVANHAVAPVLGGAEGRRREAAAGAIRKNPFPAVGWSDQCEQRTICKSCGSEIVGVQSI